MIDLYHNIGSDLSVGPTGDLAIATPTMTGQQRVLRRLLTNPGDYIWQPDYGGGIGAMIGNPADAAGIRGVIFGQVSKEAAVAPDPAPTVTVSVSPDGTVSANLSYADSGTGATQTILVGA
jgi:phage baseplate assembly protein W